MGRGFDRSLGIVVKLTADSIKEGRVRRISSRRQRTIGRPAEVHGIGFLTGATVTLRFLPAPPRTGVIFVRTDLRPAVQVPARVDQITDTNRRTTLGRMPHGVTLVEHVLAALAGLRIDNCFVQLNAPEPPGLDGSAQAFVHALHRAGIVTQSAEREVWAVNRPLVISQGGCSLAIHPVPDEMFRISYLLDYGLRAPIMLQRSTFTINPECFAGQIASCRTYLLEEEAHELRRQGIGSRTRVTDLVVFGAKGPINNRLRFADEPARHKILDLIGDLSLVGRDLLGHVVAYRSGHPHNAALARHIVEQIEGHGSIAKKVA